MKRMGKGSYGNPFSAGASTMKKKKPSARSTSPLKKKKRPPTRKRTMPKY